MCAITTKISTRKLIPYDALPNCRCMDARYSFQYCKLHMTESEIGAKRGAWFDDGTLTARTSLH